MRYLIDGYNLLHFLGLMPHREAPKGLERSRGKLLGMLHGAFGDRSDQVTVVFDGRNAPADASLALEHKGIQVRFADQADDLIELLIQRESTPRRLSVVSDDRRLQQAARRRGCPDLGCGPFLDALAAGRPRAQPEAKDPAAKPPGVSRLETQHWLKEFADLDQEPGWKELFEPLDFGEMPEE